MEQDERDFIRHSARLIEEWENTPRELDDAYSDMTREDIVRVAMYQQELLVSRDHELKQREAELAELHSKLDEMIEQQRTTNESLARLTRMLVEKDKVLAEKDDENKKLTSLAQALTEQLKRGNKERFGSKSQKGSSSRKNKKEERSRQQDKDDFDGTSGSIGGTDEDATSAVTEESAPKTRTQNQHIADMLRKGTSYKRSKADNKVTHLCDLSRIPAGAVIIKVTKQYAYEQKTVVTEHEYEFVTYRSVTA